MVVSESTGSIPEVVVTPEVCITIGSSSTSTILGFGKVGMRYFLKLCNKFSYPIVNIEKLWSLVPQEAKDKATPDNVPMLDVSKYGYFKVLGKGSLPSQPMLVKAKLISKVAEKKIKESGGAVVLAA